jgi:hypothetical protein
MMGPLVISELSHLQPHRQTGEHSIRTISVSRRNGVLGIEKRDSGRVAANRKQPGFHGGISPEKSTCRKESPRLTAILDV